jgi:hypothetical protein
MKSFKQWSEAEKAFHEDVREKKRTASGVHHKTGKNGYTGKILFASDLMSRKEKYNHRKAGKVLTTNLYDSIIPMDEFRQLEKEEQRNRMIHWRNKYQNKQIQEGMGIANSPYYKLVDELDLPKAKRVNTKAPRKAKVQVKPKQTLLELAEEVAEQIKTPPAPAEATPVQEVLVEGLHLVFRGTYTPEQIQKQLAKVELLLDGEEDSYYIEMKLMQKTQAIQ